MHEAYEKADDMMDMEREWGFKYADRIIEGRVKCLKSLGKAHSPLPFEKAVQAVRSYGFNEHMGAKEADVMAAAHRIHDYFA